MNKLQKQTTDQLRRRRNLFLNAKAFSIDPEDRKAFQKAADGLEAQMYCKVKIMLIAVTVLVLVSILTSGCGKTMRGTGLIFEGFGDAVVAGGQHLQDSAKE